MPILIEKEPIKKICLQKNIDNWNNFNVMIDVVKICEQVLVRLNRIGNEKDSHSESGQLIFPTKNDVKRISEQELRQLFIEEFKEVSNNLYYSIETPTKSKYSFTNKFNKIKVADKDNKGQSALIDMSVFKLKDNSYVRFFNIEFKHKNVTHNNISKDILKLMHEKEDGAFILLLKNTDAGTLKSVFKKISNSFDEHNKYWKGNESKFVQLVIISLEETTKIKTPFLKNRKVFQKDLKTIKENIRHEWI